MKFILPRLMSIGVYPEKIAKLDNMFSSHSFFMKYTICYQSPVFNDVNKFKNEITFIKLYIE